MAAGAQRAEEATFEAAADVDLRGLGEIAGVIEVGTADDEQLEADYFDTADLRLLRAGIRVQRRTGGGAGWRVAMDGGPGQPIEIHRPLGRSQTVPKAVYDLLTAPLGGATLAPVAHVRTTRRRHRLVGVTGEAVAEVAADDVCAETTVGRSQWREIDVHLVGPSPDGLLDAISAHLAAAGATPSSQRSAMLRALEGEVPAPADEPTIDSSSTAGDVVTAYLRRQVAAMVAVELAVRVDVEDAVHKMRVAVRRLRSALATHRRLLDQGMTEPLRDELKWLGGVLGPVRDAEVIRDRLRQEIGEQPAPLVIGPVRRRVDTTMSRRHRDAHRAALHTMTSDRYRSLLDELRRVDQAVTGKRAAKPARKVLRRDIRRAHRRMGRALDQAQAGDGPSDEELHEVRKAAKRVRYAAESVVDVFGSPAKELAERMEAAQDTLGEHQDSVVIRDVLTGIARDAQRDGEATFTYGRLHAVAEDRGRRAADAFRRDVDDGWGDRPDWLG